MGDTGNSRMMNNVLAPCFFFWQLIITTRRGFSSHVHVFASSGISIRRFRLFTGSTKNKKRIVQTGRSRQFKSYSQITKDQNDDEDDAQQEVR
jgi:hypothetical protein